MLQPKVTGHNIGSEEPEEKKRVQEAGIDASPAMSSEAVPCEATQHATTQPSHRAVHIMSLGLSTKYEVWEGSKGITIQSQALAFGVGVGSKTYIEQVSKLICRLSGKIDCGFRALCDNQMAVPFPEASLLMQKHRGNPSALSRSDFGIKRAMKPGSPSEVQAVVESIQTISDQSGYPQTRAWGGLIPA